MKLFEIILVQICLVISCACSDKKTEIGRIEYELEQCGNGHIDTVGIRHYNPNGELIKEIVYNDMSYKEITVDSAGTKTIKLYRNADQFLMYTTKNYYNNGELILTEYYYPEKPVSITKYVYTPIKKGMRTVSIINDGDTAKFILVEEMYQDTLLVKSRVFKLGSTIEVEKETVYDYDRNQRKTRETVTSTKDKIVYNYSYTEAGKLQMEEYYENDTLIYKAEFDYGTDTTSRNVTYADGYTCRYQVISK